MTTDKVFYIELLYAENGKKRHPVVLVIAAWYSFTFSTNQMEIILHSITEPNIYFYSFQTNNQSYIFIINEPNLKLFNNSINIE